MLRARKPLAERRDAVRIAGAGAEHDRSGLRRSAAALLRHLLDLVGVEHREHDHAATRDLGGRAAAFPPSAASFAFFAGSTS